MLATLVLAAAAGDFTFTVAPPTQVGPSDARYASMPSVDGRKTLVGGQVTKFAGEVVDVTSPVHDATTGARAVIGSMAQMGADEAVAAAEAASVAWAGGQGVWPQMPLSERIAAIEEVVRELRGRRDAIVNVLMWEIAKTSKDAAAEFDRTMDFVGKTISTLRELDAQTASWRTVGGVLAWVRRAAIGIMMLLGPYNYPFNETYAVLIPALLMGNCVVMKLPAIGGLAHILTMETFAKVLPPGVVNFISGSGRATVAPVMRTGLVDALALIGGSKTADAVMREHPAPHRLRTFLQLDAKNVGIVTAGAPLDVAVAQTVVGSTSYNGQRCTAIKLILVHASVAEEFIAKFVPAVAALRAGLPWDDGVAITPLPEPNKPAYLQELVANAVAQGAAVLGGGTLGGALLAPTVVYPVRPGMRLWAEEQFGPVIPIGTYSDDAELAAYFRSAPFGQQAALFVGDAAAAAPLVDLLSSTVGRININTQCGRSPDELPFSARRSSALGTMSVSEALRAFSTETLVAAKDGELNGAVTAALAASSKFMAPLTDGADPREL